MTQKHNNKIDALFVNPPSPDKFIYIRDINRHGRSSWERMIWPQTSLAYLAAVAEETGLTVDIVDCIAENISWEEYEKILETCKPEFCFSNVISVTYTNDIKALKRAKEISNAVTVAMGPHMTDSPERSLREAEGLDFVVLHEAEETLKELLELYKKEKKPEIANLKQVKGLAFIPSRVSNEKDDTPLTTDQRDFVQDMDNLPRPRHDLLPLKKYWAPFLGHYTFVEASRGCAYRCVFCRQAVMWQWKIRSRSGKKLAEEALYVNSLGVDNIMFHADTFTLDEKMVEDLCDTLIEKGSPFRWVCNTHVKPLLGKTELVKKMRKAGCWMIAVGIESGDNKILENIKKQITVEEAESVVKMIHESGIEPWGYFVLGLPGETHETMEKTINLALKLPLKMAKFDIAAPYPGTEFYRYAKEKGYLRLDKYEEFDQNASAVVEYPDLSRANIKAAARKAHRKFFLRPRVLLYMFKHAHNFATIKSLILIARDQFRLLYSNMRQINKK